MMMTWMNNALLLAIVISGALHISAISHAPNWRYYLFKPIPIVLMMVAIFLNSAPDVGLTRYAWLIVSGLVMSAIGDVFLMQPRDKFIPGLVAFLMAHLFYSGAFWMLVEGDMVWWLPAVLFSAGIMIVLILLPYLNAMLIPVTVYMLVIIQMAWAAGELYLTVPSMMSIVAFSGALIFLVSDLTLAFHRFKQPSQVKQVFLMVTYYLAQLGITYSVLL
ncbi:conserved membrane protein of unknown function [Vibrio tapetis subsp. tapetis]|uniref:Lysoplasmalogenase n=2 Tax=Vibrio tapetis TaxID=52443 RepID=A0A2N8ZKM8_9VIBR|nr:conserved membrane protein of unknown function [Vibrio tapetis subsp. tapetis]